MVKGFALWSAGSRDNAKGSSGVKEKARRGLTLLVLLSIVAGSPKYHNFPKKLLGRMCLRRDSTSGAVRW